MGRWIETTLGEVIELKRGYDLSKKHRNTGTVPVVSSSGTTDFHNEAKVEGPGVVTGRYGTIGQVFYIEEDFWPLNTALYVRDFKGNDPRFIAYFLTGLDFLSFSDKAAVPGINRNHVHQAKVFLPADHEEQSAISSVLATLDNKIELNRQISETLEAMAQCLFKSWFVDFDPVHANISGKTPAHMCADVAALFPNAFNDEELPDGWTEAPIGNIADNPRRGVKPQDVNEDTPYIGLEHMPRESISLSNWANAGKVTSNKSRFETGEFLFGKLRPYFHKVGVAAIDGICSTDILVVRPTVSAWRSYVLACISSKDFVNYTDQTSAGTKMPRTNWKDMARYQVSLPPKEIAVKFDDIVWPMVERIIANIHENRTLAELRDLLLPKLMSGEITIRDAEKEVEAVA